MSKDNTHITIPDNVTRIEGGAFKNNKSVVQVTIPDSVTYIGDEAFMGCTSLRYVNIPEKLESIPLRAFMGCTSLESIYIPGTKYIGDESFKGCTSLQNVDVLEGCVEVGFLAFEGCTSLKCVNLPDSIIEICGSAFDGCTSLKEVNTAEDLEEIFDECFEGCNLLKKAIEDKKRLKEMLTMNNIAGVINNNTLTCFDDTVCTDFVIPDGVTTIAADAFNGCTRLQELTIPESVEEIELGAFEDCENLSVINVPNNCTLLDVYDLYNTKWYKDRKNDDFVILGTVVLEYNGRDKEYAVPDGITAIVDETLVRDGLDRITCLPKGVKNVIPDAISDIGEPMIAIYY